MSSSPQPQSTGWENQTSQKQEDSAHHRRRPPKNTNRLQAGIKNFLNSASSESLLVELNIRKNQIESVLPKRYTIYEPLLLLPANTFQAPALWGRVYAALSPEQREELYASIVKACNRLGVTHIAINAPIALTNNQGQENRMRSPAGLIPLYGDFGAFILASTHDRNDAKPISADFEEAFWVRAVQNLGIVQVWAPLYTMFSRGNVTEKARILGLGPSEGTFAGLDEKSLGQDVSQISVVDMYAGIGYFVFSYLKRGVKRVWGWELNGWSVEGLRRGCEANGWGCRVLRVRDDGELDNTIEELVESLTDIDRVVIFQGDNRFAARILEQLRGVMDAQGIWNPVRHVNLGLLPSSRPSWENACRVLDPQQGGWLHIHENVDVLEIEPMKEAIMNEITQLRSIVHREHGLSGDVIIECCHVENVKTYAPGVMHCVFDIRLLVSHDDQ